jgi:hypothetical protein
MQQQDSRSGPETAQKNTRFLHLHVKSSEILERRGVCHRALSASIVLQGREYPILLLNDGPFGTSIACKTPPKAADNAPGLLGSDKRPDHKDR